MKFGEALLKNTSENFPVDIIPNAAQNEIKIKAGSDILPINMSLSNYINKELSAAAKAKKHDGYVVNGKNLREFYNDLTANIQKLQKEGNNIISKYTTSSSGEGGEIKPLETPTDNFLFIDNALEFTLSKGGTALELDSKRKQLNELIKKELASSGGLNEELISSEEFWKNL